MKHNFNREKYVCIKQKFNSEEDCKLEIKYLSTVKKIEVRSFYKCTTCGSFHLTKIPYTQYYKPKKKKGKAIPQQKEKRPLSFNNLDFIDLRLKETNRIKIL